MTNNPHPGHPAPSHRHRSAHRDRRSWPAPTFQPDTHELGCDNGETGHPWASELEDPPRDRTGIAYTDHDTAALIREAVETLTNYRAPCGLGDAGATVSGLVSLAAEADAQLWEAVADAHDQGYTWAEIADRLATTVTTARRRYAAYTKWRNTQPLKPD
jgi:hypothetical protein